MTFSMLMLMFTGSGVSPLPYKSFTLYTCKTTSKPEVSTCNKVLTLSSFHSIVLIPNTFVSEFVIRSHHVPLLNNYIKDIFDQSKKKSKIKKYTILTQTEILLIGSDRMGRMFEVYLKSHYHNSSPARRVESIGGHLAFFVVVDEERGVVGIRDVEQEVQHWV